MVGVILAVLLLTGCAVSGSNGYLRLSQAASDAFESHTVLPDHLYYSTGSAANPNAIIAIHENYTLETNLWTLVAVTEKQLRDWVNMLTDDRGFGLWTLGSEILGPQGEYIGIYYSTKGNRTPVKLLEGNRVMVFPPSEDGPFLKRPYMMFGIDL